MKTIQINEQAYIPVPDFYAGKSVFVTGATGFLGKMLVEKLLYSCPDIQHIFILIREKKNENISERIEKLKENPARCPQHRLSRINSHILIELSTIANKVDATTHERASIYQVFTRIRHERPEDLRKIIPISGDMISPDLGIHIYNEEKLINEVSVVFHLAATVKFNEPLTVALNINLEGTRKILNLCKHMKKLEVFIHLSTAYSHTDKEVIDEIIYPPPRRLSEVYKFIQQHGDDEKITASILSGRPNTYTFTKALAENLIAETHGDIPTVIIRPSIVTPSINEPLDGWIDNWYGATGLLTSIAKGVCRVVLGKNNNILDIIPADYVANLTLVSAAKLHSSKGGVTVLNSCTSSVNPITLKEIRNLYCKESIRNGFNDIPFPGALLITNKAWLVTLITIIQKTIAYFMDLLQCIFGNNPKYVQIQRKADYVRDVLSYFTSHSWLIMCENTLWLYNTLDEHDRRLFPCDPRDIDWKLYIPIYFQGVKKYLLCNK